jgi:hypothetical protein
MKRALFLPTARQRGRGDKTLHDAQAFPADLSADDFAGRHLALD